MASSPPAPCSKPAPALALCSLPPAAAQRLPTGSCTAALHYITGPCFAPRALRLHCIQYPARRPPVRPPLPSCTASPSCQPPALAPPSLYAPPPPHGRPPQVPARGSGGGSAPGAHARPRQWRLHAQGGLRRWRRRRQRQRAARRAQLHRARPRSPHLRRLRTRPLPRFWRDAVPPPRRKGLRRRLGGPEGDLGPRALRRRRAAALRPGRHAPAARRAAQRPARAAVQLRPNRL